MDQPNDRPAFNKFFHDMIATKTKLVAAESEVLGQLAHSGLKGTMREYSLANFFSDFLPVPFTIGKGIVSDCIGNQSPESDLLICNTNLLPPILINESVGVYPFETVRYWFEVKSQIDNSEIEDCCSKVTRLKKLIRLENYEQPWLSPPIPVIFGYKTTMNLEKIFESFRKHFPNFYDNPPFLGICILGLGYLSFLGSNGPDGKKWIFVPADDDRYELISFLAGVLNTLLGRNLPSFGYYIMQNTASGRGVFI